MRTKNFNARIEACIKACDGLNPEAVPLMLALLKNLRGSMVCNKDMENEIVIRGDSLRALFNILAKAEGGE